MRLDARRRPDPAARRGQNRVLVLLKADAAGALGLRWAGVHCDVRAVRIALRTSRVPVVMTR
jgi:hypothetical protein